MSLEATSDLWWKNAIIYCVDTQAFLDTNGDGIGDIDGLTQRIDYLAGLGITCLWLMPIYPSPERDYGYDVADFYGVADKYGSLGDVVELVRTARERGIRVIADLVINHTSVDHPWFQLARAGHPIYRDFYVWSDEKPPDADKGVIFPGKQESTWSYDRAAKRWYMHRFMPFQPDLNINNPLVRNEIHKVIGFWLELGLSGFRIDAVPFLIEQVGGDNPAVSDPHDYLRDIADFANRRRGDVMLLAEANEPLDKLASFFGDRGDEMHMLFSFVTNQALYLSFVRHDATPVADALRSLPPIPPESQWANFIKNHDEASLDKLSDAERKEVFAAFAPKKEMRLFERGIRRRFPSMVNGDRRRLELAYSLMLSLPGTPVLFYGEELGMAENLVMSRTRGRAPADAVVRSRRRGLHNRQRAGDPSSPAAGWTVRLPGAERRGPAGRSNLVPQLDRARHTHAKGVAGVRLGRMARAWYAELLASSPMWRPGMVAACWPSTASRMRRPEHRSCSRRRQEPGAGATSLASSTGRPPGSAMGGSPASCRPMAITGSAAGRASRVAGPIIGFHASHEQVPPDRLLDLVVRAEHAGFDAAMCSDHWAPWSQEQGESGFAWSWLGAALQATSLPFGVVNAPGQRYHPAIVAQASATLAVMFPGRFWMAIGSGENVNEHITGEGWPSKAMRNERLLECAVIMRRLWAGETVTHHGRVTISEARLWTRPEMAPMLVGAAISPETAGWVATWADALITVSQPDDRVDAVIEAFRRNGGAKKPMYLQVHLAFAPSDDEARSAAFAHWRQNALDSRMLADLRHPSQMAAAAADVRPEDMDRVVRISSDPGRHADWLQRDLDRGFEALYLHEVGRDQERFVETFGRAVLPRLR